MKKLVLIAVLGSMSAVTFAQSTSGGLIPSPSPSASPVAPALVPTYQSIRAGIFETKCLRCHSPEGHAADLPLGDYSKMLAVGTLVVPNNLQQSDVVTVIQTGKMPPARSGIPAVTPIELAVIKAWITNGAPAQ